MTRPTRVIIDPRALIHNVNRVKQCAPGAKIVAMVKANAYGCGIENIVPFLESQVDLFGVASLAEAMAIRQLGINAPCLLVQGVFGPEEFRLANQHNFQCVLHQSLQLQWLLSTPLKHKIKIWVKVNTGMHRLGFQPQEIPEVIKALLACPWVDAEIGVMTHLASADEADQTYSQRQYQSFSDLLLPAGNLFFSMANSAAILNLPKTHQDAVRPGIMLYGVSPFSYQTGVELGLSPVVRFLSAITTIHHYPAYARIGYSGTWQSEKPSIIGVVPVGYGDGYPRHIAANTPTWVNSYKAPVVGRVSMDMITVDLTECPGVQVGDEIELWGKHIPIETVAQSAGTIGYELLCQLTPRGRGANALYQK